jgi:hypothetical protein
LAVICQIVSNITPYTEMKFDSEPACEELMKTMALRKGKVRLSR